jgi:deazaflavin-dependent oxidoreductase (nitroreductase family)
MIRALTKVLSSKAGSWYFLNVANPIDKRLIPLTNGYVSAAPGQPILVLEHRGAKSGKLRRTPLLFARDGDDLVIVGSSGGAPKHPAWIHNLRAHPRVKVFARGRSGDYMTREAQGEERERLWRKATAIYPGYDVYKVRAGAREIPIVVLSRVG